MAHRIPKLVLAVLSSTVVAASATLGTISASALEANELSLNQFVVTETGTRVLTGSVDASTINQEGWYVSDDGTLYYYYADGTYATDETTLSDGYTYAFAADGALGVGWQTVDGNRYYYSETVGTPLFGWFSYMGNLYYIDEETGKLVGESEINGLRYLFDSRGIAMTGWITYSDGAVYYYDDDAQIETGWKSNGSKTYYLTTSGAKTGLQEIDGAKYYFAENGVMQTGLIQIDGTTYYFGTDGTMQTGLVTANGATYYFGADGTMQTGWQQIDGETYYFNADGTMQLGLATIDGATYYFGVEGARLSGMYLISGAKYYFNVDGIMLTGWQEIDGETYYFGTDGAMRTGLVEIDGETYYFASSGAMQTGWVTDSSGSSYYINEDGTLECSGYAPIELDVPDYKQTDSRWSNTTITYSTIGKVGCLVTSIAMKYSYETDQEVTPDAMLSKLSFDGDNLLWSSFTNLGYTRETPSSMNQTTMQKIYSELQNDTPVIVGGKKSNGNQHYVVVTGYAGSTGSELSLSAFTIHDPGSSSRATLSDFFSDYPTLYAIIY